MKTRILLSLMSILLAGSVLAGIVPLEKAEKAALNFYYQKHNQFEGMISIDEISIISTYTESESDIPYYYVFHINKGGYVVVSAEDLLHPVIAYSFKNEFDTQLKGLASRGLMNYYKDMIRFVRQQDQPQRGDVKEAWSMYLSDELSSLVQNKNWGSVGPLLTTLWNQNWPYNYYCPETPTGGSGGHVVAGCVTTAIEQILYYHRWPDHGRDSLSYIPTEHPEYGVQSADFENTWYRYEEMSDHPETVNLAIAELLYHVGVANRMEYGPSGSGVGYSSYEDDSTYYYFKLLNYHDHSYYRDSTTYEDWIYILKDNMDRKLPVYYAGFYSGGTVGHAFVCDGYQDSAYFHFNLGWGGQSNGYYTIDSVSGFNYFQYISTEVYPDTLNYSYPLYPSGADTLTYVEGSIEDGSGPIQNYLNNHYASWLIDPQNEMDSVTNIRIELKRLDLYQDGDRLYIYDGKDNSAPLIAEFSGFLEGDSAITSSGNQAFVEFITDGANTSDGFYLSYYSEQPIWCSGTTQITEASGTFDDGSTDFYYNNDRVCIWDIDPGIVCPSLELSFNYFITEDSADILYVYDLENMELLAEISGEYTTPPPPVVSGSGKIRLRFKTNNSERNEGWEVTYHMVSIDEVDQPLYLNVRPNPASTSFNVAFTLYDQRQVSIDLYDVAGEKVRSLQEQHLLPGTYSFEYSIERLKAGMYFCRMQAGNVTEVRKLVVH
ncbi:MAG: C10 family peptidase [Bacteroidales bacterium]|nr:C10 family peptidase [Bacteroidales bacterium]